MKIYAIVIDKKTCRHYAAHIPEHTKNVSPDYTVDSEITKSEYQKARANGMPSWGETQVRMAKEQAS